jgi:hypothetical protein
MVTAALAAGTAGPSIDDAVRSSPVGWAHVKGSPSMDWPITPQKSEYLSSTEPPSLMVLGETRHLGCEIIHAMLVDDQKADADCLLNQQPQQTGPLILKPEPFTKMPRLFVGPARHEAAMACLSVDLHTGAPPDQHGVVRLPASNHSGGDAGWAHEKSARPQRRPSASFSAPGFQNAMLHTSRE